LQKLTKNAETLVFVGDGINDTPSIALADIGIAMTSGAGTVTAIAEAADIIITDNNPQKVPLAIKIALKTKQIVSQNITFALATKFLVQILCVLGFAEIYLAVLADVGVCLICVLNSSRGTKFDKKATVNINCNSCNSSLSPSFSCECCKNKKNKL
jgi:Cd2+/Zn2+-exporting ATPase